MWEKEILKQKLDKLKFIRDIKGGFRNVEFGCNGCTDSMFTRFQDKAFQHKDEMVSLLIATAIKYLEDKLK